jgi:hypothetical protein
MSMAAAINLNPAFPQQTPGVMLEVHQWFRMPSGRIAEVQRFETVDDMAAVVVRYLNDDGDLVRGSGEFTMRLSAFLKITKRVEVSRG